jgi:hypothetical protein
VACVWGAASFSIGFKTDSLLDVNAPAGYHPDLTRILYDAADQTDSLLRILHSGSQSLHLQESLYNDPDRKAPIGVNDETKKVYSAITYLTFDWAHSVKHEAFSEEKEWRLSIRPAIGSGDGDLERVSEVRELRGRLLPYIIIRPKDGRFAIHSITVGPSTTQALEAKAVKLLLAKSGLKDIAVHESDTPLQS